MRYLILLSVLLSTSLQAGSIHKWVDSEGNTHYGDAPPVTTTSKQVRVQSAPSDPGKALPRLVQDKKNEKKGDDVPADQATIVCQQAQDDLSVINSSSRIQVKAEDGSLRYLSTEEIASRKEKIEADIEQFC